METVGNYPDLATAQVAMSILEAEGIEATIPDEHMAGIGWQMSSALQGIRVQVAIDDALEARRLLATFVSSEESEDETSLGIDDVCPACGSQRVGAPRWKQRVKAISFFFPVALLSWPILALIKARFQCSSCGHAWR